MTELDAFEEETLDAHEHGGLKFTPPSKSETAKFKAVATATVVEQRKLDPGNAVRATRQRSEKSS